MEIPLLSTVALRNVETCIEEACYVIWTLNYVNSWSHELIQARYFISSTYSAISGVNLEYLTRCFHIFLRCSATWSKFCFNDVFQRKSVWNVCFPIILCTTSQSSNVLQLIPTKNGDTIFYVQLFLFNNLVWDKQPSDWKRKVVCNLCYALLQVTFTDAVHLSLANIKGQCGSLCSGSKV